MKDSINIGMIGYKFMGKAHSHAYRDVSMFFPVRTVPVMRAICGRTEKALKEAARVFGWQGYETSWEKLVKRKDIDLIDINTPNYLHKDIAIAAAQEGKIIFCEKPLAINLSEAREMVEAVNRARIKHMVAFNYRTVPAIALAKKFIDEGKIGKIYHFRAVYLQDWITNPEFPLVWRLQKESSGSGVHGDLNSHLIDLARFLVGEFDRVIGMKETFVKERPLLKETEELSTGLAAESAGKMGKVTVDDATLFLAKFKNGALGSLEATRFAPGRRNGQRIEINGSQGSLVFELEDMNKLWFYSSTDPEGIQGFRSIQVTEPNHPYTKAWWPPGHIIGYEHTFVHLVADLMNAVADDRMPSPNFSDGLKCQEVLEAVDRSIETGHWIKIEDLYGG